MATTIPVETEIVCNTGVIKPQIEGVTRDIYQSPEFKTPRPAPLMVDIAKTDLSSRQRPIRSRGSSRVFKEDEAIRDMQLFLDRLEKKASQTKDLPSLAGIKSFRSNMVFIGEPELKQAVSGFATRLKELSTVCSVVVYRKGDPENSMNNSDTYINTLVLEEYDRLTLGEKPKYPVMVVTNKEELSGLASGYGVGKVKVVVLDDVVLSGHQMGLEIAGTMGDKLADGPDLDSSLIGQLMKTGKFNYEEAKAAIEIDVIAAATDHPLSCSPVSINLFSYYGVTPYLDRVHSASSVSVSSNYSSTDYGWNYLINQYRDEHNNKVRLFGKIGNPLLFHVTSPYEQRHPESAGLYRRWENIQRSHPPAQKV